MYFPVLSDLPVGQFKESQVVIGTPCKTRDLWLRSLDFSLGVLYYKARQIQCLTYEVFHLVRLSAFKSFRPYLLGKIRVTRHEKWCL